MELLLILVNFKPDSPTQGSQRLILYTQNKDNFYDLLFLLSRPSYHWDYLHGGYYYHPSLLELMLRGLVELGRFLGHLLPHLVGFIWDLLRHIPSILASSFELAVRGISALFSGLSDCNCEGEGGLILLAIIAIIALIVAVILITNFLVIPAYQYIHKSLTKAWDNIQADHKVLRGYARFLGLFPGLAGGIYAAIVTHGYIVVAAAAAGSYAGPIGFAFGLCVGIMIAGIGGALGVALMKYVSQGISFLKYGGKRAYLILAMLGLGTGAIAGIQVAAMMGALAGTLLGGPRYLLGAIIGAVIVTTISLIIKRCFFNTVAVNPTNPDKWRLSSSGKQAYKSNLGANASAATMALAEIREVKRTLNITDNHKEQLNGLIKNIREGNFQQIQTGTYGDGIINVKSQDRGEITVTARSKMFILKHATQNSQLFGNNSGRRINPYQDAPQQASSQRSISYSNGGPF